jgi:imidazole glycerol-phosphate synthase subunit HisH
VAETIALVDYGAGNLHSVANALKAAGAGGVLVTSDPGIVAKADRIVLPGVGAFAHCIGALTAIEGMAEALEGAVLGRGRPFLGICVGMQLMAEYGVEDGTHAGLGWVAGTVQKIPSGPGIKVPHMGWNQVEPVGPPSLVEPGEAYFLHSYAFVNGQTPSPVRAMTDHGGPVVAAIQTGTALGVQFHPEKSQSYGLAFLERFLKWKP